MAAGRELEVGGQVGEDARPAGSILQSRDRIRLAVEDELPHGGEADCLALNNPGGGTGSYQC